MSDTPTAWRMVRLPVELADRLASLARDLESSYCRGRAKLPAEYCERVPIHHVIDRALSEVEAHRDRSRRRRPRRGRASINA